MINPHRLYGIETTLNKSNSAEDPGKLLEESGEWQLSVAKGSTLSDYGWIVPLQRRRILPPPSGDHTSIRLDGSPNVSIR